MPPNTDWGTKLINWIALKEMMVKVTGFDCTIFYAVVCDALVFIMLFNEYVWIYAYA